MTFYCKNFDIPAERCSKLKGECIPGRRGCVLEGKVKLSEDLQKKVDALSESVDKSSEK